VLNVTVSALMGVSHAESHIPCKILYLRVMLQKALGCAVSYLKGCAHAGRRRGQHSPLLRCLGLTRRGEGTPAPVGGEGAHPMAK